MSEPRQLYTQAANPNPYAPQYPSQPLYNNYGPPAPMSYPPPAGAQYPPDKPQMSVQQPQATYQQQQPQGPPMMAYNQPPVGTPPPPQGGYGEKPGQPIQTQPAAQRGMNPNAPPGGHQYDANGERDWSHDLFDCFSDCGTCCFAYFCPCMVYQQVKSRLEHLQRDGRPDPEHGGSGCGGDCCIYGLLTGFCGLGWVLQMSTRASIRSRHRIRGGACTDCMASCCCIPCELTQESRELDVEEGNFH